MNINPNLLVMLAVATTISTFLNLFLLGFIKGICSDFLEELKEIKKEIEEQNNKPPEFPLTGMFQSIISEIIGSYKQENPHSKNRVYTMNELSDLPTTVLHEALKVAETNQLFEDAAKIKAELDKRGAAN